MKPSHVHEPGSENSIWDQLVQACDLLRDQASAVLGLCDERDKRGRLSQRSLTVRSAMRDMRSVLEGMHQLAWLAKCRSREGPSFRLQSLIRETVEGRQSLASSFGVSLELEPSRIQRFELKGDRQHATMVLGFLLDQAMGFVRGGSVRLELAGPSTEASGTPDLLIHAQADGSALDLSVITLPVEPSSAQKAVRSLCWSLAAQMCQMLDWDCCIRQISDQELMIILGFPGSRRQPKTSPWISDQRFRSLYLLVLARDEGVLDTLCDRLSLLGCPHASVKSLGGLLTVAQESAAQPNAAVVDLESFGADGLSVLKTLKRAWPELPLIMRDLPDEAHALTVTHASIKCGSDLSTEDLAACLKQLVSGTSLNASISLESDAPKGEPCTRCPGDAPENEEQLIDLHAALKEEDEGVLSELVDASLIEDAGAPSLSAQLMGVPPKAAKKTLPKPQKTAASPPEPDPAALTVTEASKVWPKPEPESREGAEGDWESLVTEFPNPNITTLLDPYVLRKMLEEHKRGRLSEFERWTVQLNPSELFRMLFHHGRGEVAERGDEPPPSGKRPEE